MNQSPWPALFKARATDPAQARPGRTIELLRDIPEGLQHERVQAWDLALVAGRQPVNQDGEVDGFLCLAAGQALERAASGEMTVDAELLTLDFALRHRLIANAADWQTAVDRVAIL